MARERQGQTVTVREFLEVGQQELGIDFEAGETFLDNVIHEGSLNRPGLALAGFTQYFANKRMQVFGLAELSYLKSLDPASYTKRLKQFFSVHLPCVVITRSRHAPVQMRELAQAYRVPLMRTPMITMRFVNRATVILEELLSPQTRVHGTMVDILGIGVMIKGEAGIGKSEAALALIERGHSLVADDVTILRRIHTGEVIARAVEITRYHMEIRGLGIIHVPSLFGVASMREAKRLDLVINLVRSGPGVELDRTGLTPQTTNILDEEIPLITLPVAPGRDIAHVVEVAALNQKLKHLGHDAAKELDDRLIQSLGNHRSRS